MDLFRLLITFFLLALIASCDPGTGDTYFIDNTSDYKVSVSYANWEIDTTVIVESNVTKLFYENYYIGEATDLKEDFLWYFDTISVNVNDTLIITKELLIRENWQYQVNRGDEGWNDGGISVYTFHITNDDISDNRNK